MGEEQLAWLPPLAQLLGQPQSEFKKPIAFTSFRLQAKDRHEMYLFLFRPLFTLGGSLSSSLLTFLVSASTTIRFKLLLLFPTLSSFGLLLLLNNKQATRTLASINSNFLLCFPNNGLWLRNY